MYRRATEDNRGAASARLTKNEPWVLFFDNHFDVARNRGEGPCAAAYAPDEVIRADASGQTYACYLSLYYSRKVAASHVVVWDFKGMTNAQAKEYMKAVSIDAGPADR